MMEDYFLIMRIKRGDTDAWEVLVDKYYDKIFAYCLHRSYGNRALASDVTQDIFLKVVQAISSYRYKGKFSNFLYTIAVNHCNTIARKKELEQVDLDEHVLASNEESVTEILTKKEESQLLQNALERLPAPQREALILRYYQEMKVKDIAKVTGVGVATVQSRIYQGLQKLGKWLDKKEFGDD